MILRPVSTALWIALVLPLVAAASEYDLVLRVGKVIDGTGNPWFYGDIAVRGDKIAAMGRISAGAGKHEIDATGLVVAPGFIDMHAHSDWLLIEDGDAQSKIRQGVTTEVLGEGGSAAPWKGKLVPHRVAVSNRTAMIVTMADYFKTLEESRIAVNVVSYVGLNNVWQAVMGQSFARPTPDDVDKMKALVREAMEQGAFGLSSQVMMPPGSLATTDELVALCGVVRDLGGIYATHIRNEGLGVFESVQEVIEIAERSKVPADILHLKIADEKYWGRMNEVVALIEQARLRGVNVQANVYPYTRGNNNLSSIIPPWAHEGGRAKMLERLRDSATREKMKQDIRNGIARWYNHYTAVGGDWSRMLVSDRGKYKGMTMDRVIADLSKNQNPPRDALDVMFDLLIESEGSVGIVYAHHTEKDMNLALAQPWCSIGSDGSAYAIEGPLRRGNPHPRNFGTFPCVLGVYVREQKLLRLEDAVRKMTSLNATKLGIFDRGSLRPGNFADIVLFDAERVIDRSTYTDPFHYNEGIEYVIVNGEVVLEHGTHTGKRPGKVLRKCNGIDYRLN
jgi:N-acyl-D-aspartate/D-glutamate deacylase